MKLSNSDHSSRETREVAATAGGSSGRPINLYLDGVRYPVTAEDAVAESLTRTALGQQRRRAGRMPGWFGG